MIDIDLKRQFAKLNKPSPLAPCFAKVPNTRFLMLDGLGDIGGPTFQDAVKSLYGLAYPVKFAAKKRLSVRYPVMPLEGLYWDPDGEVEFTPATRESFAWRLMIMLPNEVTSDFVDEVRESVAQKKELARLADIRVATFSEGLSIQIMHLGPYADEKPAIESLFAYADETGVEVTGRHHEIYLGKPDRADQSKLKTVIRYGIRKPKKGPQR
ncbi:MAG: GyrI-like domain-containing protein [Coriobacteriia bacterium]|nr:GyrI-like domain-containing protein [Coriobacteriia bacterium]